MIKYSDKMINYEDIYGAFGENDSNFFEQISKIVTEDAVLVEIGSFEGRSAICMCNHLIKNLKSKFKYYCVDPFTGNPEQGDDILKIPGALESSFLKNTSWYRESGMIHVIKDSSLNPSSYGQFEEESIDFIFIDGLHDHDSVYSDISKWYPKIKKGGIISGHDFHNTWFGVKSAVDLFVKEIGSSYTTSASNEIFWFVK